MFVGCSGGIGMIDRLVGWLDNEYLSGIKGNVVQFVQCFLFDWSPLLLGFDRLTKVCSICSLCGLVIDVHFKVSLSCAEVLHGMRHLKFAESRNTHDKGGVVCGVEMCGSLGKVIKVVTTLVEYVWCEYFIWCEIEGLVAGKNL